jgi:hypothetical protein
MGEDAVMAEGNGHVQSDLETALLALQREAIQIQKDAEGQIASRRYKYVSLTAISSSVLPRLTHYGLLWSTKPIIHDGEPALHYALTCISSGEKVEGVMSLAIGANPTPQEQGSGLTYARRYSLMALLNLVPIETDDDGAKVLKTSSERKLTERRRKNAIQRLNEVFPTQEVPLFLGSIGVTNVPEDWTESDLLKMKRGIEKRAKP